MALLGTDTTSDDSIFSNVLPFFSAVLKSGDNSSDNKAAVAVAQAQANSTSATLIAKQKTLATIAVVGVASLALIYLIKKRRG